MDVENDYQQMLTKTIKRGGVEGWGEKANNCN